MNKRKEFRQCIDEHRLIETGLSDHALASELCALAKHRFTFWKTVKLEETYPSLYIEGHYEIIKELLTAILAFDGWKAADHECLFSYLREKRKDLDLDVGYLLELKDLRNDIAYRGVKVSAELWTSNKIRILFLVNALLAYVEDRCAENR